MSPNIESILGLVSSKELAEMLGVTISALNTWRYNGFGPPYIKLGRKFLYNQKDVETWVVSLTIDPKQALKDKRPTPVTKSASTAARLRETLNLPRVPRGRPGRKIADE